MPKDNEIHIANNTNEDIVVLVAPNPDWEIGDIVGDFVKLAASVIMTCCTLGETSPSTIRAFFSCLNLIRSGITSSVDLFNQLKNNGGITIKPGQAIQVFSRTMDNPFKYLEPSEWGALCGASDMTLAITNASLTRQAVFNSNSDYSWIVNSNNVVRAKYGSLHQQDAGSGEYPFSIGAQIIPGGSLEVGASIAASNMESYCVMQADGNLVVYNEDKPVKGKALWAACTNNSGASELTMTSGGIYVKKPDGTAVWSKTGSDCNTLVMQDDHNLVLYDNNKKALWSSNTANKS